MNSDKRFVLIVVAANVLILAVIFSGTIKDAILGPECDAICEMQTEQFMRDHPDLFEPMPTPDPAEAERIIQDVMRGTPADGGN